MRGNTADPSAAGESEEIQSGDLMLVESLYRKHRQMMYNAAYSILKNPERAEDAVHDAFVRVIAGIDKFKAYSRRENASYLVIVVKGIALNMLSDGDALSEELSEDYPAPTDVEGECIKKSELEEISKKIERLPPMMKSIAVLRFYKALSAGEIGELLGISESTVYSTISRIRDRLKSDKED